ADAGGESVERGIFEACVRAVGGGGGGVQKKVRWEAVHRTGQGEGGEGMSQEVSVVNLCRIAGMTRQNYYKQRRARERELVDESLALELIRRERCRHPR